MFMADDKKKAATIIIASGKSMEAPKNDMGDEVDASAGLDAAAADIVHAIHAKDAKMLKSALVAFMDMCEMQEPEEVEEESYED